MANKKDFSNVNTQPIYNMREEATAEPLPGQLVFKGNNGEIAPLDEAEEMSGPDAVNALEHSKAVFSTQLAHADLDNLNFLDTMAGIYGITRQAMLNDILQDAREESKIYNEAVKLRKEAEKGRADGT